MALQWQCNSRTRILSSTLPTLIWPARRGTSPQLSGLQTEEIDGSHTHLLPQIILHKVHFPIPVTDDLCIQIQADPFDSTIDWNGSYLDWPGMEDDKFQSLLISYGESRDVKTKLKTKNIVYNLLRKDDLDSSVAIYKTDALIRERTHYAHTRYCLFVRILWNNIK